MNYAQICGRLVKKYKVFRMVTTSDQMREYSTAFISTVVTIIVVLSLIPALATFVTNVTSLLTGPVVLVIGLITLFVSLAVITFIIKALF